MAQTTGAINAKNLKIELNSQNISGSSNNVSLNPVMESGGFYTFDGNWRKVLGGKFHWSGNIRAVYTEETNEALDVIWTAFRAGVPVALTASPAGGNTGDWEWSGDVLLTEPPLQMDGGDANPILVEVSFEGDGELSKAAIATT